MLKNRMNIIIYVVISFIIILTIIFYMKNSLAVSRLNNMYKDIETLEDEISIYYLNNSNLPVKNEIINFENSINPNDDEIFYEIDLSKLENIDLSYGNKYYGQTDIYIINQQSHTIYYLEGISYNNRKVYTREIDYTYVDTDNF